MITGEAGIFQSVIEMMFKWQNIKEQIQDAVPTRSYSENYKETNNLLMCLCADFSTGY